MHTLRISCLKYISKIIYVDDIEITNQLFKYNSFSSLPFILKKDIFDEYLKLVRNNYVEDEDEEDENDISIYYFDILKKIILIFFIIFVVFAFFYIVYYCLSISMSKNKNKKYL